MVEIKRILAIILHLIRVISTNMKIGLMTKAGANPLPVQVSGKGPGAKYFLVDSESQDDSLTLAHISVPVIYCYSQSSDSGSIYTNPKELI